MTQTNRFTGDRGDIVLGWLTRVAAVLLFVGVVAFDLISVGATSMVLSDQARHAAREASSAWQVDPRTAYSVAV